MKRKSINTKIVLPIVGSMILVFIIALLRLNTITKEINKAYLQDILQHKKEEMELVFKGTNTLQEFLDALKPFLQMEDYTYLLKHGHSIILRDKDFPPSYTITKNGYVLVEDKLTGIHINNPNLGLELIMLRKFKNIGELKRKTNETIYILSIALLLMIISTMGVLRRNLITPLKTIINKINRGECAPPVDIKEMDELVEVINNALATAEMKTFQADALHRIAVSLNKDWTIDEIMDTILEKSRLLLGAEYSAFALYDEEGNFKKLRVSGLNEREALEKIRRLPAGKGILKLMQLSLSPVRIDNLQEHPAFSGAFPEGHPIVKSFLGYPVFSRDGKPLGALYFANKKEGAFTEEDEELLMAIASDVAVAIQRVNEAEELKRFKKIIDSAFDIIIITDKKGTVTYVNKAFETLTGYTASEVIGKDLSLLKSDLQEDDVYEELWNTILSGNPWKGELINKKKNGDLFITSAVVFPIFSEDNEITNFVSIQRDITEEEKLYEQLLIAQKMESIGTLAGGFAHDFNNILSIILGYAEILKDMVDLDSPLYKPVDIIQKSAERGASLASKILTIAKKGKTERKVVNLNRIVEDTLDILYRSIPKEIEIKIKLQKDLPPIKADPTQIQQVIMNLAINAKDAMPEGGVLSIETSRAWKEFGVSKGITPENEFVRLTVSDTGRGIEKEMQTKIFDPFFTTKERGAGTGLGLYIVHTIVTNHGGYINLYSEPGRGTRFNIYFPVYKGRIEEEKEIKIDDLKGSGTVLVIDDEEDILRLTKDLLAPVGYNVLTAKDGREGIKIFEQKRDEISVVVLDMIMPGMSGKEVFQRLKEIDPKVKVILCSGYSEEGFDEIKELLKTGIVDFVQKPFSRTTLALALKRAITSP